MTWREALDSPGIRDVQRAATFFRSSSWTELRPDVSHQILTKDYVAGDPNINAVLAATQDASVAVAYFTGPLSPTFDLSFFESDVDAEWVDPTTNAATSVDGSPFTAGSTQVLTPPSANASNAEDWLLVLRAR
jgi:hypothetical protein